MGPIFPREVVGASIRLRVIGTNETVTRGHAAARACLGHEKMARNLGLRTIKALEWRRSRIS